MLAPTDGPIRQQCDYCDDHEGRHRVPPLVPAADALALALNAGRYPLLVGDFGTDDRQLVHTRFELRAIHLDQRIGVDLEEPGVRPQKAFDSSRARQNLEIVLLERLQILPANLRSVFDILYRQTLTNPCLSESIANIIMGSQKVPLCLFQPCSRQTGGHLLLDRTSSRFATRTAVHRHTIADKAGRNN